MVNNFSRQLIERRIENQEKILRTLEDIPLKLEGACGDLMSFHYDKLLVQRIQELVNTLLVEIAVLIRILLREPEKRSSSCEFAALPIVTDVALTRPRGLKS